MWEVWGDREIGRWGPTPNPLPGGEYGEMGEIFIKGNYPDMIYDLSQLIDN
ncbi:MAG: hypothetical protein F6J98_38595 [Moorea sp. SIO4G2]|uniref:hypothetical protein n=1 Tax=unclassified Moorena TaxID=2683338 RepID=UPI0013FB49FF|nr:MULTISPECIES: hypothetical protein [unclassified Moorena]NEO12263.1 hypothetical protein [Moorena sp. SIO3E8]NEO65986.1 hypothetical protein [Moorena sp. SIO4G2]NEP98906.1 hypothetical protein [Moorena sp. SIO3F7]